MMLKRGLFGAPLVVDGLPNLNMLPPDVTPIAADPRGASPAPEYHPPSTGRMILGTLGDTVSQWAGGRPIFAPQMQAQRERQQQLADEQRRQAAQYATWQQQQEWKQAHPDTPDIVDRMHALDAVEPGLGGTYARNYANNGGGVPQLMNVPGIGLVSIPRGGNQAPSAPSGPAPGTVHGNFRFKGGNPKDPSAWEPMGGAPSQGGATFR